MHEKGAECEIRNPKPETRNKFKRMEMGECMKRESGIERVWRRVGSRLRTEALLAAKGASLVRETRAWTGGE